MLDLFFWTLIPVSAVFFIFYALVTSSRRMKRMKSANFAWYTKSFPAHVHHGRVSCMACSSKNVGTERMMERTYMRRHFCRQCGTTLYYSPEQT